MSIAFERNGSGPPVILVGGGTVDRSERTARCRAGQLGDHADTVGRTMLGRAATLEDVGNVAAFAASDHARTMTATALNITCGAVVD